ncbi:MAG: gliding motility-associated C-terminal domain-containing protein, partial [Crocinitomicaceae bacterium]|nr:gliding motility-associated C-terminal domain-containing protein [Crocinitomicaceae bacterium]
VSNYVPGAIYVFTPTGPIVDNTGAITGMIDGTDYTVTSTIGGCISTASATFKNDVQLPTPSTVTITSLPATCVSSGSSSVSNYVPGAIYVFTPTGPIVDNTGAITGMIDGTDYTVTSTIGGCISTASATFKNDVQMTLTAGITNNTSSTLINCSTSSISVTATGGGTYAWDNGLGSSASASITDAGTYTVTVTGSNGCTDTESILVTKDITTPVLTVKIIDIKCWGVADGSIEALVTGGKAPFEYYWSVLPNDPNIITTNKLLNIQQQLDEVNGVSLYIKDANGCLSNVLTSIEVKQPNPLVMNTSVDASIKMNCFGLKDGSISINPRGGVKPYSYSWIGNDVITNNKDQTGLGSGDYFVTIKDANNCAKSGIKISISSHPQITFGYTPIQPDCSTDKGQIVMKDEFPVDVYSYSIDGGSFQALNKFVNLVCNSQYEIRIKNSKGCISDPVLVDIDTAKIVPSIDVTSFTKNNLSCINSNASIRYTAGKTGFIYSIDNFNTVNTTGKFENLVPSVNYQVYIKSMDNCVGISSDIFRFDPVIYSGKPSLANVTSIYCYGSKSDDLIPSLSNNVKWYDQQGHIILSNQKLSPGKYYITGSEPGKCESEQQLVDIELSRVDVKVLSHKETVCNKATGSLQVQAYNGYEPYIFSWKSDEKFNNSNSSRLSLLPKGTYQLIVTDKIGCKDTSTYYIDCEVNKIPQIVSPNGDGDNDQWVINYLAKYPNVKVEIYNRWGNLIYKSFPYEDDWNGISNMTNALGSEELPTGTYYYIIDKGNGEDVESGYLELVK